MYSPVLVPALIALAVSWRRVPAWTLASAGAGLLHLLVQVRAVGHAGGRDFFAYRISLEPLSLAAPALVLAAAETVRRHRWQATAIGALAVVSIAMHGYGAVVGGIGDDTNRAWQDLHATVQDTSAPRPARPTDDPDALVHATPADNRETAEDARYRYSLTPSGGDRFAMSRRSWGRPDARFMRMRSSRPTTRTTTPAALVSTDRARRSA